MQQQDFIKAYIYCNNLSEAKLASWRCSHTRRNKDLPVPRLPSITAGICDISNNTRCWSLSVSTNKSSVWSTSALSHYTAPPKIDLIDAKCPNSSCKIPSNKRRLEDSIHLRYLSESAKWRTSLILAVFDRKASRHSSENVTSGGMCKNLGIFPCVHSESSRYIVRDIVSMLFLFSSSSAKNARTYLALNTPFSESTIKAQHVS